MTTDLAQATFSRSKVRVGPKCFLPFHHLVSLHTCIFVRLRGCSVDPTMDILPYCLSGKDSLQGGQTREPLSYPKIFLTYVEAELRFVLIIKCGGGLTALQERNIIDIFLTREAVITHRADDIR